LSGQRRQEIITKFLIAWLLLGVLSAPVALSSCSLEITSGKSDTIIIAATPIHLNTLIYVAEKQGFFTSNRIEVKFKDYDTGVAAVDGLLKGETDIALTTEYVMVGKLFQKQDVIDLVTIDKSMLFYIIARTDRGIQTFSDLKGKRIGVPRQTITEFYLGRTLSLHRIGLEQVSVIDTKASDPAGTIAGGDVDAVVTWEPNVTQVKQQLGHLVITFPAQSSQLSYWSTVTTPIWINQHSDPAKRFLKSLVQAEEYVTLHEHETKALIKKRLNHNNTYINAIWPQNQFSLSLDQSLIIAMEDEARWMINSNLTTEKRVPDFVKFIYEASLKSVKPQAVNIIR
jgi:ABC-type nitrate/sulfonate/bicarbonate transport system substrate-binding protein